MHLTVEINKKEKLILFYFSGSNLNSHFTAIF